MSLAVFAVAYLAAAEIGQLVAVPVSAIFLPAIWPATGLLAAALIHADRTRWRRLIAVSASVTLVSTLLIHRQPALTVIVLAILAPGEALATAWVVRRMTAGGRFALNHVSHAWALVIAAAGVPLAGAAIAPVLLGAGSYFEAGRAWWLAEILGILLSAPIAAGVLADRQALAAEVKSWRTVEMALLLGVAVAMAQTIFGEGLDPLLRVPTYFLPLLMWPVFRFGPGRTSFAVFVVVWVGLWHAAHGQGVLAIAGGVTSQLVVRSQGAGVIAAVSFLLLASIVAERKRMAREHVVLVAELQQALAEVKTLQGFIPICAWCHKVRDDEGFWHMIEQYLSHRTDATFSHSICPACAELAKEELTAEEISDARRRSS